MYKAIKEYCKQTGIKISSKESDALQSETQIEKRVDKLESVTGVDLDGVGDVGGVAASSQNGGGDTVGDDFGGEQAAEEADEADEETFDGFGTMDEEPHGESTG